MTKEKLQQSIKIIWNVFGTVCLILVPCVSYVLFEYVTGNLATVPDLILRIIVANILTGRFGSMGIWMAWPFGWIAATVLTVIFYRRIVTGKYCIRL